MFEVIERGSLRYSGTYTQCVEYIRKRIDKTLDNTGMLSVMNDVEIVSKETGRLMSWSI